MTGAYLRVKRDNKWENIEIEHLTDKERQGLFVNKLPHMTVIWLNVVCKKLTELEPLLNDLEKDGIIKLK